MPKFVLLEPVVTFAGSTVTTSTAAVTLNVQADNVETTAFGSQWRTRVGGLKEATVDFDFHADLAAGAIDSLLWTNLGGTVNVKVRPGGTAAISATNPEFQFDVMVAQVTPVAGSVGDLATQSVSFPVTGTITRATA